MNKLSMIVAAALLAAPAVGHAADVSNTAPAVAAMTGKVLVDAKGARIAPIYRVSADGSAEVIFEGQMVTVPASTLSVADGKVKTSLAKHDLLSN